MQETAHSFGHGCFECKGVEGSSHLPLQRRVDHLVLLNPALAYERSGGDASSEMVAIASEVGNNHFGIRECLLDKPLGFPVQPLPSPPTPDVIGASMQSRNQFRDPLKIHKNEAYLGAFPAPFHQAVQAQTAVGFMTSNAV
jgi:hypothetical protein